MAKSRKRKKRPGRNYKGRSKSGFFAKKKNPFFGGKKKGSRRRRRAMNPWLPGTPKEILEIAGGAVGGGLAARLIPENTPMIQNYNSGPVGYGLNLASGYVTAKVLGYLFTPRVETGALAGTVLMTVSRLVSDYFGKTIVSFGRTRLGFDPAFRLGKYVSSSTSPLPPLPVPTAYPSSGPVPPLPVGTSLKQLPAATTAATSGGQTVPAAAAGKTITAPSVAAASSMGAYGRGKFGTNRFM